MSTDAGLAHSWERERCLLGAIMQDNSILFDATRILEVADFHRPEHAATFALISEMAEASEPYDVMAIFEQAQIRGLPTYGGAQYLLGLPSACPSVHAWQRAALDIRRHAFAREVKLAALRFAEAIDGGADPGAALAHHETALLSIRRNDTGQDGMLHVGPTADEILADYGEREVNGIHQIGEPTGYVDLDKLIGGLVRKDLILLGARPSMGKTALALNIAANIAKHGGGVGVFSMEMGRAAVVRRMIATEARINFERLLRVGLLDDERARMVSATHALHEMPIYVDEKGGLSISELRQRARRLASTTPNLRLLIVDYVQLAKGTRGKGQNREQEVAEVSMGLKVIARELDVPILALAQLNRALESRPIKERRPMSSDLRDSGQLEQDADVVLFLYRDEVYDPMSADRGVAEVIVAKQRNGRLGTAKLTWDGEHQRFSNLTFAPTPGHGRYEEGYV